MGASDDGKFVYLTTLLEHVLLVTLEQVESKEILITDTRKKVNSQILLISKLLVMHAGHTPSV